MNYSHFYNNIAHALRKKEIEKSITLLNTLCVSIFVLLYVGCLIVMYLSINPLLLRALVVPFSTVCIATILRRIVNRKRPYETYDIKPLIQKKTQRQSFPSRHIASATILCLTTMMLNPMLGIIAIPILLIMSILRIVGGVHYPSDIFGGIALGLLCGFVGYCLI